MSFAADSQTVFYVNPDPQLHSSWSSFPLSNSSSSPAGSVAASIAASTSASSAASDSSDESYAAHASSSCDSSDIHPPLSPTSSVEVNAPASKRRRAAVGVSEPVKRSHRQLDADRRQKEGEALRRLEELTGQGEIRQLTDARQVRKAKKRTVEAKRREKLSVLQSSIAHIERLQAMVARLTEAGDVKERRMQELTHHLRTVAVQYAQLERAQSDSITASTLSASTPACTALSMLSSPAAEYLDSQHALYSSIFISSGLMMMLLDLDTAVIIDANSRFIDQTGFTRDGVIGKRLNGKGGQDQQSQAQAAQYDIVKVRDRSAVRVVKGRGGEDEEEDEEDDEDLPWIEAPLVHQYPSSMGCLMDVREGRRESFRAPWRCIMADGRLVEVESMCVVAKRRWTVEADGRAWERPVSLLVANGWTDSVPINGSADRLH